MVQAPIGEAAQSLQGDYVMHIVHTVRQMETKETLRRCMQHIQTVSKTLFYNKILTSKIFGKALGDPLLPCVHYIDPKVPLSLSVFIFICSLNEVEVESDSTLQFGCQRVRKWSSEALQPKNRHIL